MGPALFCLPLRPVLTKIREEYESQGIEAYAYLDHITIAVDAISPETVGVVPFLEKELTARGINLKPGKTVALAPKGHVPTPEEIAFGRSECPHRGCGRDKGSWGTRSVGGICDIERYRDSARWGGGTTRADAATNAG